MTCVCLSIVPACLFINYAYYDTGLIVLSGTRTLEAAGAEVHRRARDDGRILVAAGAEMGDRRIPLHRRPASGGAAIQRTPFISRGEART